MFIKNFISKIINRITIYLLWITHVTKFDLSQTQDESAMAIITYRVSLNFQVQKKLK